MHTPAVLTETAADTVMVLMLTTARRVVDVAERVKAGDRTESIGPAWFGVDVHHKTLGIVGMGRIGMKLAQRAHLWVYLCRFSITLVGGIREVVLV